MMATVGRIPVAGPILSSVTTQMLSEELSKVQIIKDSSANDVSCYDLCQALMKPEVLWTKNGTFFDHTQFGDTKIFILYFSAHWCPPCKKFTPILAKQYDLHLKQSGSSKSCIIFVSRDKSEKEQMDYMKESHGDWPAVPCQSQLQTTVNSTFQVEGNSMFIYSRVPNNCAFKFIIFFSIFSRLHALTYLVLHTFICF